MPQYLRPVYPFMITHSEGRLKKLNLGQLIYNRKHQRKMSRMVKPFASVQEHVTKCGKITDINFRRLIQNSCNTPGPHILTIVLCADTKAMLQIRTMCHACDLWKVIRSCKQLHLLCPPDPCNLPGTALHRSPWQLWYPLHKTVIRECSFISIKGYVNIWSDRKAQKWLVRRSCKYFS